MRQGATVFAGSLFKLLAVCTLALVPSGNLLANEAEATLKIERQTPIYRFNRVDVYINGKKVGTVDQGKMAEFKFEPKSENLLSFKIVGLLQTLEAGKTTFAAKPGSVSKVLLADIKGQINVDIKPEKMTKLEVRGVKLKTELEERELASEIVETPPGVEQEYELSRTLERSVSFTEALSLELGGKLDLKIVGADIRAKIERQENQTFKTSETIRRNVKLDGTKAPKVKVIWIGTFKTGTATVYFDDTEKKIPFSLQVGLKPKVTLVKD